MLNKNTEAETESYLFQMFVIPITVISKTFSICTNCVTERTHQASRNDMF